MSQEARNRPANRLVHETSPYLLQHAYNPVDWYPWGEEALHRARSVNKPILLSIGYSACHWCHVMERESFEDDRIAQIMNEQFICIKVDREERPDLDEIYMQATLALNQGQGGWPMTVFLTPEQQPIFAGTEFPPATGLSYLLRRYHRTCDPHTLQMVRKTLDAMATGGLYDQIGGGFARYSTDERWLVPHFEKMLYDNALLTRTYLEAYQVTGE